MLLENPRNPLNLVGGSKFFTYPQHYRFQIGFYSSFDGGCTWQDGGVFPGFNNNETTSDVPFAFGLHNDVYALVIDTANVSGLGESGLSVLTSRDGGRTFSNPVSVFDDRSGQTFADKPWIAVDQTNGPHPCIKSGQSHLTNPIHKERINRSAERHAGLTTVASLSGQRVSLWMSLKFIVASGPVPPDCEAPECAHDAQPRAGSSDGLPILE